MQRLGGGGNMWLRGQGSENTRLFQKGGALINEGGGPPVDQFNEKNMGNAKRRKSGELPPVNH